MTKDSTCPASAESVKSAWPNGSPIGTKPDSQASSVASPAPVIPAGMRYEPLPDLGKEVALLLQMHKELLSMVGALIEQNKRILRQNEEVLAGLTDVIGDSDIEPRTYLDGTPVG